MRLTDNFTLSEFSVPIDSTKERTAYMLALTILQPLRDKFGPLVITSGYRNPAHNKKIGGAAKSEHCYGDNGAGFEKYEGAVDISIKDHRTRAKAFQFVLDNMPYGFGQLIWYTGTTHLHISLAGPRNQGEALVKAKDNSYKLVTSAEDIKDYDNRIV